VSLFLQSSVQVSLSPCPSLFLSHCCYIYMCGMYVCTMYTCTDM
jgi:hypothetical protein